MREVARFYDAEEAKIAAGFLRAQGFDVTLPEEHHLGVAPHMSVGLGGYRLLAADSDFFLARAALDETRPMPKHGACRRCGSDRIRRARHWWFPLVLLYLFGSHFPFAPARDKLVCRTCGLTWKDEDHEPQ